MLRRPAGGQRGALLIEALVAILLVSFGLMALAGLQATMTSAVFESYQRTQALSLMQDMAQRMEANPAAAGSYVTPSALGTGDAQPASCVLAGATRAQVDQCEWSRLLKGASETFGAGTAVGAVLGGRGCVEQLQAPEASAGVCQPGVYRVSVAWQGFHATVPPAVACGQGQYAREALRKTVSVQLLVPLPGCS